jgi:stage V sporulation protein D (sporulation-specific penicillin-binding protein)
MLPRKLAKKDSYSLKNTRINICIVVFAFLFLILEARLFNIQVVSHGKYSNQAEEQYTDNKIIQPRRGKILTSDGYVLADNQIYYLLYAEPKKLADPADFSKKLAGVLANLSSTDTESLEAKYYEDIYQLVTKDLFWVPIKHFLTPIQKDIILSSSLPGIGFDEEPVRYYPEGTLASQILGFIASNDKGDRTGYYGIEGSLNEDLKGKPGRLNEETDASGLPLLIGGYKKIDPIQGRDIVLTIKRPIQYLVEKLLKEGVEKYDAISGSVIVMDPTTGEVLAMANYPTFDPGNVTFEEDTADQPRRKPTEKVNSAIAHTYEPGSVMKPFTISAAIELGLVTPETTYEDNGQAEYSGRYIDNWDGKHWGTLNIVQLLQKSNNIGAAWVGHLVGSKKLFEYFSKYGFGHRTNIDLEGEDTGVMYDYKDWLDIDLAVHSFGQGLSATPLQVLNGFNALINGGFLLEPKIISKIVDGKKEITIPTKNLYRIISPKTAETMVELLEKAAEGGEAQYFTLKDYRIGGKTGTAEVPEEGRYSKSRTNATFVGFMVGTKKFSMIVRLEEPKTSVYAAETAVPMWMDIAKELVKYFGITPDRAQTPSM